MPVTVQKWLKNNWFSIFTSTMAFVLSTAVNQGIDWYKDIQVQDATKSGVANETTKNLAAIERFNNKNIAFKDSCQNKRIDEATSKNLYLFPVSLSNEYYLSNGQKISELNGDLLNQINQAYNAQQLLMNTIPLMYSGLKGNNKEVESEVYDLYCDYQDKLKKLNENFHD